MIKSLRIQFQALITEYIMILVPVLIKNLKKLILINW